MPYQINPFTGDFDFWSDGPGIDHGLLGGLLDDDHTQYLLLAGRTGATNNPLLSTDARGEIIGSGAAGFGLGLSPVAGTVMSAGDTLFLAPEITTIHGLTRVQQFPGDGTSDAVTIDTSAGPAVLKFDDTVGHWTISDPANPFLGFQIHNVQSKFQNPTGVALSLARSVEGWYFNPTFLADDAACTLGEDTFVTYTSEIGFVTVGSGTIAAGTPVIGFEHSVLGLSGAAGTVVFPNIGYHHEFPSDAMLAPSDDTAFLVDGSGAVPPGINASLRSTWDAKRLRHAGPGIFGSDAEPSNISVGLEVLSTTKALLPSRLTTTQRDALTPLNGMVIYNSTFDKFQGYEAGVWRFLTPKRTGISNASTSVNLTSYTTLAQTGTMSAARTWTLPAANSVPAGFDFLAVDESGTVNGTKKITIAAAGADTIEGAPSLDITAAYGFVRLMSDGASKWTVIG
jgi:hypothetical protein